MRKTQFLKKMENVDYQMEKRTLEHHIVNIVSTMYVVPTVKNSNADSLLTTQERMIYF